MATKRKAQLPHPTKRPYVVLVAGGEDPGPHGFATEEEQQQYTQLCQRQGLEAQEMTYCEWCAADHFAEYAGRLDEALNAFVVGLADIPGYTNEDRAASIGVMYGFLCRHLAHLEALMRVHGLERERIDEEIARHRQTVPERIAKMRAASEVLSALVGARQRPWPQA